MVSLKNQALRLHLSFVAVFIMFMVVPVMAQPGDDSSCNDLPAPYSGYTATVPSATGQGDILLSVDPNDPEYPYCSFICNTVAATVGTDPGGFTYPYGLVSYTVQCDQNSPISANVTITFPGDITGMTYRKYGPTTFPVDIGTSAYGKHISTLVTLQWYTFAIANGTPDGNSIILHLTEGQLGDDNPNQTPGQAIIIDPGGPGQPPASVPTMTEWGMIVFVLLAGLGSVYYLRRQKRANT